MRHGLAMIEPRPDQVTIAINSSQMNVVEQMVAADVAGTSLEVGSPGYYAYREMTIPAGPEWVEEHIHRLSARGICNVPNIYNLANFVRACPDGSVLTVESSMLNTLPLNMMGTVEQIEQLMRIAREFGRPVANGREAREIYKIGTFYDNADQTLAANGFAPNRKPRQLYR